jgi:hypothetical protein
MYIFGSIWFVIISCFIYRIAFLTSKFVLHRSTVWPHRGFFHNTQPMARKGTYRSTKINNANTKLSTTRTNPALRSTQYLSTPNPPIKTLMSRLSIIKKELSLLWLMDKAPAEACIKHLTESCRHRNEAWPPPLIIVEVY